MNDKVRWSKCKRRDDGLAGTCGSYESHEFVDERFLYETLEPYSKKWREIFEEMRRVQDSDWDTKIALNSRILLLEHDLEVANQKVKILEEKLNESKSSH